MVPTTDQGHRVQHLGSLLGSQIVTENMKLPQE